MEQEVEQIVSQYTTVVDAFNGMFKAMSLRREDERWRIPGEEFGTGSCKINKPETAFRGIAKDTLIELAERKLAENPVKSIGSKCRFHGEHGCILGGNKPPMCVQYIDNHDELETRFGIKDSSQLSWYIRNVLGKIMDRAYVVDQRYADPFDFSREIKVKHISSEETAEVVEEALTTAKALTKYFEEFPILHPEEVEAA